jgi:prolipoprotein diacylglyceryltransferase
MIKQAIQHLPAILFIIGTLAVYAFYALFVVAGVVLAINSTLELLNKLLGRITGGER